MTEHRDKVVLFNALSFGNITFNTVSAGQVGVYSLQSSNFTPLRTLAPTETSAANIARFLCTLVNDLASNKLGNS